MAKANSVVSNPDEPADPEEGSVFAEWAMLTLHVLRTELNKSYRVAVDLLSEMPGVLAEIGLTRLPHYTVLRKGFEGIPIKTWRAFLGAGANTSTSVTGSLLHCYYENVYGTRPVTRELQHSLVCYYRGLDKPPSRDTVGRFLTDFEHVTDDAFDRLVK